MSSYVRFPLFFFTRHPLTLGTVGATFPWLSPLTPFRLLTCDRRPFCLFPFSECSKHQFNGGLQTLSFFFLSISFKFRALLTSV